MGITENKINQIHASNVLRINKLAEQGIKVQLDSVNDLRRDIRLSSIYEAVVSLERQAFDRLKLEELMSKNLDDMEKDLETYESENRKSMLLEGIVARERTRH